jgi:hypothetical protein
VTGHGTSTAVAATEGWVLRTGLSMSVWLLAGIATVLAASGQVQFAHWAGIVDARAYAVPAVLELVAVAFLLIGYRRARRGDSPAVLWMLAAIVGGFAVYTNVMHGGPRAGLVFGAASALALILWFVKLRDDYRHFQRHTGQATRPRPKLGALWFVAPRLCLRASVIAARRRISTVDHAVACAEVWRAVYEDARTAGVRRPLARRTAWRSVAQVVGGAFADLPTTAEVAAVTVFSRASREPAEPTAAASSTVDAASAGRPAESSRPVTATSPRPPIGTPQVPSPLPLDAQTAARSEIPADADAGRLGSRVFAFLDSRLDAEDIDVEDPDDPYLLWTTARGLGESAETVASHVRAWCAQQRELAVS